MKVAIFAVILFWSSLARSAPFQNLDFEMARIESLTPVPGFGLDYEGPTADLLPGWQLFFGSQPVTTLGFNLSADPFLLIAWTESIAVGSQDFIGKIQEATTWRRRFEIEAVEGNDVWALKDSPIPESRNSLEARNEVRNCV